MLLNLSSDMFSISMSSKFMFTSYRSFITPVTQSFFNGFSICAKKNLYNKVLSFFCFSICCKYISLLRRMINLTGIKPGSRYKSSSFICDEQLKSFFSNILSVCSNFLYSHSVILYHISLFEIIEDIKIAFLMRTASSKWYLPPGVFFRVVSIFLTKPILFVL